MAANPSRHALLSALSAWLESYRARGGAATVNAEDALPFLEPVVTAARLAALEDAARVAESDDYDGCPECSVGLSIAKAIRALSRSAGAAQEPPICRNPGHFNTWPGGACMECSEEDAKQGAAEGGADNSRWLKAQAARVYLARVEFNDLAAVDDDYEAAAHNEAIRRAEEDIREVFSREAFPPNARAPTPRAEPSAFEETAENVEAAKKVLLDADALWWARSTWRKKYSSDPAWSDMLAKAALAWARSRVRSATAGDAQSDNPVPSDYKRGYACGFAAGRQTSAGAPSEAEVEAAIAAAKAEDDRLIRSALTNREPYWPTVIRAALEAAARARGRG